MFKKVTAIIISAVMLLMPLSGCSVGAKSEINSTCDWFLSTLTKLKYEKASEYVMGGDTNYLNYLPYGSDKQIVEALLANCEYEISGETASMADGEGSADITFTFADVHQLTEDGATVSDLKSQIRKMKKTTEAEFTMDLIKDGSHWFIDPDSATEFMIFMGSQVEGIEVMGLSDQGAAAFAEEFLEALSSGDMDAAVDMNNNQDLTLSTDFQYMYLTDTTAFTEAEGELLASFYSSYDYNVSIVDSQEDYIRVNVTGQAPDIGQGMDALTNDIETFAPLYADCMGYYFLDPYGYDYDNYDYDYTYIGYVKILQASAEYATSTAPFSLDIEISEKNNGDLYISSITDLIPSSDMFSYGYMNTNDDELMLAVLNQLLADGTITQATYEYDIDMYGLGTYVEGLFFTYGGDELYMFDADISYEKITMNITTWGYYNSGDVFAYDIVVDGVTQPGSHTIVVEGYDTDDIVLEYPLQNGEFPAGEYVFNIYEEGGSRNNVVMTISVTSDGLTMSEDFHPSGVAYDTSYDFYSLSSYTDPDHYNATTNYSSTSSGIYILVDTWSYNDGTASQYTYEITLDGEQVASGTAEHPYSYSSQLEITYRNGRSSTLAPGEYIVTVYQPDGTVLCRVNYNVQ